MSDQDSSKMRVSERNETCFNCRTEAVSHLQNAKTQKCKKVLNQFSQLTKKTHIFCSEKRRWQTENRAVHCAQMCRKYTPKGKMGHPKWQNGIAQKVKWDIPNGVLGYEKTGFQASEHGCRGGVLGCRGQRNGVHRPRYTPKIGWNRRKEQSFLQFSGHTNSIIFRYKTREKHTQNLWFSTIQNIVYQHIAITSYSTWTPTSPPRHPHYAMD